MPDSASSIDEGRLRRIILAAHGLHRQAPFGRGRNGVLKALTQLGYAQIDTISVVERAHHHVLRSRIPGYRPALLDALVARREVFEYWFHAAAYLPMSDYRFARPRMDAVRRGEMHFQGPRDEKLMRRVHDRIRAEGPLSAADFDGERGPGGWWEWKPAKQALEILFFQGDLMVAERKGFQKRYDLAERVLPADIDTRAPSDQEYARHLIDHALRLFASTTVPEAGYLRRSARLREALRAELAARVEAGTVREIQLRDGSRRWLDTAAEAQTPRIMRTVHVLSPFDPLVIQRGRTAALFGFDYQIECYLPQSKRRFGYFCLPLLYGDRFLGQMDCKADRARQRLELRALHLDQPVSEHLREPLQQALAAFAQAQGCESIETARSVPRALRSFLTL